MIIFRYFALLFLGFQVFISISANIANRYLMFFGFFMKLFYKLLASFFGEVRYIQSNYLTIAVRGKADIRSLDSLDNPFQ